MSRQLTLAAAISILATLALAIATGVGDLAGVDGNRAATAHGSVFSVLLRG